MKGNNTVIQHLQTALTMELTAVNQYLLHWHVTEDWGLSKLAKKFRQEMEEEQGHAAKLLDRIIFLEGLPDCETMNKVKMENSVKGMLESNLRDEYEARNYYTRAAEDCREAGDEVSRELFVSLTTDEEGHIDYLETQLELIKRIGDELYAQKQM